MNKQVIQDLKNLTNWLNANKMCLIISKTEAALFKSSRKLTDVPLKLKLNGKRLYPTNSVKYLGTKIDENLNWKQQISDITTKLNRANAILSELKYFIDRKILKSGLNDWVEYHHNHCSMIKDLKPNTHIRTLHHSRPK